MVVVVAEASDKGVQGKEAAAEEESVYNEVTDKNIGELFDMFYLRLPLTSNSTFIIFVPGLPRYSYQLHRQEGQGQGGIGSSLRKGDTMAVAGD